MILRWLLLFYFIIMVNGSSQSEVIKFPLATNDCETYFETTNPLGPIVHCSVLPDSFIECREPVLAGSPNSSSNQTNGKCSKWGGTRIEDIEYTTVTCNALPCIPCHGFRVFEREVPCIKYTGHYFLSTLLYSVLLGVAGVDRFCLGYSAMAVGKLMTIGGFGVWWLVDIFLLIFGVLLPADDSNWEPYY